MASNCPKSHSCPESQARLSPPEFHQPPVWRRHGGPPCLQGQAWARLRKRSGSTYQSSASHMTHGSREARLL